MLDREEIDHCIRNLGFPFEEHELGDSLFPWMARECNYFCKYSWLFSTPAPAEMLTWLATQMHS